jgi:hypothetical protein
MSLPVENEDQRLAQLGERHPEPGLIEKRATKRRRATQAGNHRPNRSIPRH